jgi:hypothetical protein
MPNRYTKHDKVLYNNDMPYSSIPRINRTVKPSALSCRIVSLLHPVFLWQSAMEPYRAIKRPSTPKTFTTMECPLRCKPSGNGVLVCRCIRTQQGQSAGSPSSKYLSTTPYYPCKEYTASPIKAQVGERSEHQTNNKDNRRKEIIAIQSNRLDNSWFVG